MAPKILVFDQTFRLMRYNKVLVYDPMTPRVGQQVFSLQSKGHTLVIRTAGYCRHSSVRKNSFGRNFLVWKSHVILANRKVSYFYDRQ